MDNPFAYYRLSEAIGSDPVADERGDNAGEYVNDPKVGVPGAITTDRRNTAVSFARDQQQYIKLTDFGSFGSSMSSGFTVEYWLKTQDSTDHQTIFGTANSPGFITDIAYGGKAKRLRIYCRDDHSNRFEANFYPERDNIDIYDDHWHYIVHVYDPYAEASERILLYVDGARQTLTISRQVGVPAFSDFNHPLSLGTMDLRGVEDDHLEGSLDDVAFYLSPLSEAQIKQHYRAACGSR